MAAVYYEGVVKPAGDKFNAEEAATKLYKAMKGLGTNEKKIIEVLSGHCNFERQIIKQQYKTMYGKDVVDDLEGDLSGNFLKLCLFLIMNSRYFDAFCIREAIDGWGTNEDTLIDILASRTNHQLKEIKEEYKTLFKRELEKDIEGDVSGDFKRILISLMQGNRSEEQTLNMPQVDTDAKDLFEAGEGSLGTDESVFNRILALRSIPHLRAVFEAYRNLSQKDIEAVIKSETSGHFQKALLSIVRYVKDPLSFYADCFHETFKGAGTDDNRLMQLVVSHCETDIKDIGKVYLDKYKKSLPVKINSETSGDYKRLLFSLTNPAN